LSDISPDGKQFAVVRRPGGQQQLEYPIGKVLYRTNGYISQPRISPDGKQVAFLDHPLFGDNRGSVALADASGKVRRLTEEFTGEEGLAWSWDGREIWFAATNADTLAQLRAVFAVTPGAKLRKVFEVPGDTTVWDVGADGRLLFTLGTETSAQMVASPVDAPERNVSVLGFATFGAISTDGKAVAFTESGLGVPDDYLVLHRRLDAAIRGDWRGQLLRPDAGR
jgi:dipeptidyl aminopeptidase/acylaminoacyl peptidase